MANGNVKLSVSGVDQFKRGMKEAQTSVKTLDAELKLNEQQFRLTGDAEVYMEQKTEILKRQIEQQKTVVDQAEKALAAMKNNGVDPTSQSFQQMQQNLLRAQGALMGMEADLNNVGSAGQTAAGDVGDLKSKLQNIGSQVSFKTLMDGLESLTGKLKSAASAAWNLGKEIVNATLGAGEWADELATEAKVYGIGTDDLQRMRKTARIIDTDVETIIRAQKKLKTSLGNGSEGVTDVIGELLPGYDLAAHDWEDVFWDTGEAILAMADAEKQEAYAQKVFGKSWADLIPLFEAGRQTYEETNAGWNVVSEEALENLGKMDDQYQKLVSEWETFKMTLLSTLSGPLTAVMEKITDALGALNKYLASEEGQKRMEEITTGLTSFFESLISIKPEDIVQKFADALDAVKGAFEWIEAHWQEIVNGIKAIAMAFAGMQLAALAANLLSIGTSLGFFGGGGGTAIGGGAKTLLTGIGKNLPEIGASVLMLYPLANEIMNGRINPMQDISDAYQATLAGAGVFGKQMGDLLSGNTALFSEQNKELSRKAANRLLSTMDSGSNIGKLLFGYRDPNGNLYDPNAAPITGGPVSAEAFSNYWNSGQSDRVLDLLESSAGQKNSLTSDDISTFRGLPAALEAGVRRGIESANIQVVIQDDAVQSLTTKVGNGLWSNTMNLIN